jgi:hypothetical protein
MWPPGNDPLRYGMNGMGLMGGWPTHVNAANTLDMDPPEHAVRVPLKFPVEI